MLLSLISGSVLRPDGTLLLRQIHCVVVFLSVGIDARDEHHFVAVVRLHYDVVDLLHIVRRIHGTTVDVGDDEAVLDA